MVASPKENEEPPLQAENDPQRVEPRSQKYPLKRPAASAAMQSPMKKPAAAGVSSDWRVEHRTRTSGASEGKVDVYFVHVATAKVCRSFVEVQRDEKETNG